jgi:hypothetical protein
LSALLRSVSAQEKIKNKKMFFSFPEASPTSDEIAGAVAL